METIYPALSSSWTCGELNSPNSEEYYPPSCPTPGYTSSTIPHHLDLDPDPCPKTAVPRFNYKEPNPFFRERNELSEVLISLKTSPHVGVTMGSGRISPMPYSNSYNQTQPMFSPSGYSPNYCIDQTFGPSTCSSNGPNFGATFPAMSVNVSMNMTMGYIPSEPGLQHQVQWSSGPMEQGLSPPPAGYYYGNSPTQNYCHQPYSATYNFAADFRPEPPAEISRGKWIPISSPLTSNSGNSSGSRPYSSSTQTIKRHRSPRSSESTSPSPSRFGSKSNLCRTCGKTYARPSTLKTHLRTHSGEKPYRCNECHKSFSQAANLTAHVRTHSGEKPFRCPICDRKFSQSSSVTTHMRTHSGERPYRCRLCKKAFSDSSTLTKHLRIHSGEKPYQCKLCLLRFSQSGNLNRHMRVHSNNV